MVTIFQQPHKHQSIAVDRMDMATLIERSDRINAANFSYPLRGPLKMNRERNNFQWLQNSHY